MTTIAGLPITGTHPIGGSPPPSGLRDLLDRVVGLASPGGLLMRAAQPVLAEALRRSGAGAGTEWGPSLQRVLDDPRSVAAFQAGMAEGALGGAKAMVGGLWDLTKGVARAAYDTGPLGWAIEGAQRLGVLGEVPGWAPDAGRVTERAAAIGGAVGDYAAAVGRNPAKLSADVKGWIARNWDALTADHAKAAAQGGAAEARWWGRIAGRATFEVAATVVPVTKFATVAQAGRALQNALKAGKVAEAFAEAAQAGKLAQLFGAAAKLGKAAELVAEARKTGRLDELAAAARKTPGGLEALGGKGGLTAREIGALEKGGALSKAEAGVARVAAMMDEVPPAVRDSLSRMTPAFRAEYAEARAAGWKKPNGDTWWPPNNGGVNAREVRLPEGAELDRYGAVSGGYLSPRGDPFPARALPKKPNPADLHDYDVAKPVRVEQAEITPWFDQPGGGRQFRLLNPDGTDTRYNVKAALKDGYLVER